MRAPKTGNAPIDRAFQDVAHAFNKANRMSYQLTTDLRTISASFDATLHRAKQDETLDSIFLDVDATVDVHATNIWTFQVALYRPNYSNVFYLSPLPPFDNNPESFSTAQFPITAHLGLLVPFNASLIEGDVLVLEGIKSGSAADLDDFFIETCLTKAR